MIGPRRAGFSQFGGLTGDLESGSRKRQGLAEARKTAQARTKRTERFWLSLACYIRDGAATRMLEPYDVFRGSLLKRWPGAHYPALLASSYMYLTLNVPVLRCTDCGCSIGRVAEDSATTCFTHD